MSKELSLFQRRRNARQGALQALYQWEITQENMAHIEKQFEKQKDFATFDQTYFHEILQGIVSVHNTVEPQISHFIKRYIDRPVSDIDPVELSILRIATFELFIKKDVPYKVILNEALELTKIFGATLAHKFVNGVLDKIAREVRHAEINKN